ncbi:hypothetical protein MY11210_001560 [Beauveria gryllotalpidicola]
MSAEYDYEVLDLVQISSNDLRVLHEELRTLGAVCFNSLPPYQVFVDDVTDAFRDKIIVVAKHHGKLMAFVSAVTLQIDALENPVIHSGLTVIHPRHRRSFGVIQLLHGHLWMHLLGTYKDGFWMTTLAEVISSLVHMSKFATKVYPSPQWLQDEPSGRPGQIQLEIAREINAKYRRTMLISPSAEFEEMNFVFRGSNNHAAARVFMKDVDDTQHWHRDTASTEFYRGLFRKNEGDEVLQIGYMDPEYLTARIRENQYRDRLGSKRSKL